MCYVFYYVTVIFKIRLVSKKYISKDKYAMKTNATNLCIFKK